ncbi:MAG: hypothetical protein ACO3RU_10855 [Planctomycetota bacterium]
MAARTTRQVRSRSLFEILFGDPWRKLLSIGIAVLLWHYLDSQVSLTEEIGLPLTVAHVAGDLDTTQGTRVFVRLDTQTYSVLGFVDPASNEKRGEILLELTGEKRILADLEDNPGFSVRIDPTQEQGELTASFTADDVRPMNPRFEGLIARMTPPRVVVRIGRNVDRQVAIDRSRIDFCPPGGQPDFAEQLVWEDARFEPTGVVKLRGPVQDVERVGERRLYKLTAEAPLVGATRFEAVLRAVDLGPNLTLLPDSVQIKIPIRVTPRTFRLLEVPVVLQEPDNLRGKFQLRKDSADVEIEAFRTLEAVLSGLGAEDLRRWVRENVTLVASLPRDAIESDAILSPRLLIKDYYERMDFRMTVPPTVHFDPKDP